MNISLTKGMFSSSCCNLHFQFAHKHLSRNILNSKVHLDCLKWKSGCIDRSKLQQRVMCKDVVNNYNVYEACDFKVSVGVKISDLCGASRS